MQTREGPTGLCLLRHLSATYRGMLTDHSHVATLGDSNQDKESTVSLSAGNKTRALDAQGN